MTKRMKKNNIKEEIVEKQKVKKEIKKEIKKNVEKKIIKKKVDHFRKEYNLFRIIFKNFSINEEEDLLFDIREEKKKKDI
ncbi:hypothetical protein GVAV_000444 [Gurleya vavrai]